MDELLYLVHRIPYPPNKGDKIRSYHLLKHLAQTYKVHVGAFVDDTADWSHADTLTKLAGGEVKLLPLHSHWATLKSAYGFLSGEPLTMPYYRDHRMQRWVDRMLQQHPITHTLIYSSCMAQYVQTHSTQRRVIDFVDIDSDKWRQYADKKPWPMRWVYQREAHKLLDVERRVACEFDAATFVSSAEANMFKQLAPECADQVFAFSNGVDTESFSPLQDFISPYTADEDALVFTGAMDYWANVDAVCWFAREVWPALRLAYPRARFYIVGSRPSAAVQALENQTGIVVTGSVPDTRPYMAYAKIALAPLRIARGIQNKVLEAMAMAKPSVVTPQALEGIAAQAGEEILVADTVDTFHQHIRDVLEGRYPNMGKAARKRVLSDFSWSRNLRVVNELLKTTANTKDHLC